MLKLILNFTKNWFNFTKSLITKNVAEIKYSEAKKNYLNCLKAARKISKTFNTIRFYNIWGQQKWVFKLTKT